MATKLSSPIQAVPLPLMASETTQSVALGTKVWSDDGRAFRYVKAGGTALVQGKLQQSGPEDTAHQGLAVAAAAAIGATTVTVTLGASAVTANEYAEGFLIITVTPGEGFQYKIKSHPAADSSASVVLTLEDPIEVALTTSSKADMVLNPYSAVILNPTALSSVPIGVAVYPIPDSNFGWIQVEGVAAILADGANAVGSDVVASNGTAGAVEDAASSGAQPLVGRCVTGAATGEYGAVLLNLE
jgi:hypothetical protein